MPLARVVGSTEAPLLLKLVNVPWDQSALLMPPQAQKKQLGRFFSDCNLGQMVATKREK